MFQTTMTNSCCHDMPNSCAWCLCGFFFPCCTQCYLRYKVLDGDMSKYSCFQGEFSCCCGVVAAGKCNESSCPEVCLCCESFLLPSLALSASRETVRNKHSLRSDPCDIRLIRFSNCMWRLSCFCFILSLVNDQFRHLANIIYLITDVVYHTVAGCMTAQTAFEIDYQKSQQKQPTNYVAPVAAPVAPQAQIYTKQPY